MASGFKDILRWALGWKAAPAEVIPDTPGMEWTLPENRLHFTLPAALLHFTLPENRLHFTLPEED